MSQPTGPLPPPREMTFWEHLDELRGTLVRSLVAVLLGMAVCLFFAAHLQDALVWPFARTVAKLGPEAGRLALLTPTEGFLVRMKLGLFGGLLLASPWVFLQLWAFVAPALKAREKRLVLPVVGAATLLFLSGAAFGYAVMAVATEFLLRFATPSISNTWSLSSYLTFTVQIMLGLGLVFQLPLVLLFLMRLGLVTPAQLAGWRRHAAVAILVAVALLPMQDPLSLLLMAAPLYLLFEVSILVGRLLARPRPGEPAGTRAAADDPVDQAAPPGGKRADRGERDDTPV